MVYCGLYPVINEEYTIYEMPWREIQLNDAVFEAETSAPWVLLRWVLGYT